MKAIVLGARDKSGNIGDETAEHLRQTFDMTVETHDCVHGRHGAGAQTIMHAVPSSEVDFASAEALVVTVGKTSMEPFDQVEPETIRDVIYGSLTLPLLCAREYVEQRGEQGGRIVLVGSYAHRHPFSTGTAYCAAKAGLDMAGKTLGWELTDKDFYTFVVHPYHVEGTPMWEEVQQGVMSGKNMTREEADAYAHKDLKMRLMKPHEIGDIIGLLLTEGTMRWMSGSNVELFGGTR